MEYPAWYVPGLGATMLIPVVSLVHVLVSHFAVGGGILLWLGIRRAHAERDDAFLAYLKSLTRFFVLITVVFGAITGVGIWWTIALASPQATSTLIHAFVFGWATEWVTFVVEIVAAFGLFYYWDRLTDRGREWVAFTYAVAAWLSLAIITGILSFMLSTSTWPETFGFWDGFLNITFLPSVVARTGGALAITGLYFFLHVSFTRQAERVRDRVVTWASRWSFVGIGLIAAGGLWWLLAAPDYVQAKVLAAPAVLIISFVSVGATLLLTAAIAYGPGFRTDWLTPPLAALLFALGATGLFSGEFLREAGRKPYTVERYLFSNNVMLDQILEISHDGYVNTARWPRLQLQRSVPGLFDDEGRASGAAYAGLNRLEKLAVGETIYEYQCGECHTRRGYNGILPRVGNASRAMLRTIVVNIDELTHAMPPWAGQEWEADAVADYLYHAKGGEE